MKKKLKDAYIKRLKFYKLQYQNLLKDYNEIKRLVCIRNCNRRSCAIRGNRCENEDK